MILIILPGYKTARNRFWILFAREMTSSTGGLNLSGAAYPPISTVLVLSSGIRSTKSRNGSMPALSGASSTVNV